MSIRIETEKIVRGDGYLYRKIVAVKMLTDGEVPALYTEGEKPIVYLGFTGKVIYAVNRGTEVLYRYEVGNMYLEDNFQSLLDHCRKAGDHLMTVNAELKAKRADWNGKETFVI